MLLGTLEAGLLGNKLEELVVEIKKRKRNFIKWIFNAASYFNKPWNTNSIIKTNLDLMKFFKR